MIPFTTCMRFGRARRGARPGDDSPVEWRVQHPADVGAAAATANTSDQGQLCVNVDIHIEEDEEITDHSSTLLRSEEDDGSLTLSTRIGGRRRSSSSIRFADDTDTGTDILVITEEALDDILADPIYGDYYSSDRRRRSLISTRSQEEARFLTVGQFRPGVKRQSLVAPYHHRHLLHGVHGMSVGGAGALAYDARGSEQPVPPARLLLTLRRRKASVRRSIHIDPISLLDYSYHHATRRFLENAASWRFNSFTLDTMTGGHSLSNLLIYLFTKYGLIDHFKLDILCVWKCFRLFETGYHDTNPYHNSVHAADVTQAMHCFIQEKRIGPHLSPMETMCSILAAVAHDLDHPGVNQHFLIATNSHLAALYNNHSVLESHHWRFAISCLREAGIFDHFSKEEWAQVEHLLKSLILATDITQQATYLGKFRATLASGKPLPMALPENRLFILQIALKCADLGNPCRPWALSKRWSEQICSEFYRQGDFEQQLALPVTPICNRYEASMAKIQTDFFRNVVTPLFELWDQFLSSKLSRQLIANLRFNNDQWESFLDTKVIARRHSFAYQVPMPTRLVSEASVTGLRRVRSLSDLDCLSDETTMADLREQHDVITIRLAIMRTRSLFEEPRKICDRPGNCGTPSTDSPPDSRKSSSDTTTSSDSSSKPIQMKVRCGGHCHAKQRAHPVYSCQVDEAPPVSPDLEGCEFEAVPGLSSQHPLSPCSTQMFIDKAQYLSGRRGSAPGCIGVYASCELAAAAALVFIQGAVKAQTRRSSAPVEANKSRKNSNNSSHSSNHSERAHNLVNQQLQGAKWASGQRGRSLEVLMSSLTSKTGGYYAPHTAANVHHHGKFLRRQACSLDSSSECQAWLYAGKPRRGSVPQEVLIESLSKYPSHTGL